MSAASARDACCSFFVSLHRRATVSSGLCLAGLGSSGLSFRSALISDRGASFWARKATRRLGDHARAPQLALVPRFPTRAATPATHRARHRCCRGLQRSGLVSCLATASGRVAPLAATMCVGAPLAAGVRQPRRASPCVRFFFLLSLRIADARTTVMFSLAPPSARLAHALVTACRCRHRARQATRHKRAVLVPMRAALQDTVLTQVRRPRGVACAPAKLWQLAAHGTCRRRARRPMGRRCALVACLRRADVPAGSLAPPIDTRRHAAALRCRSAPQHCGPAGDAFVRGGVRPRRHGRKTT
ncbi:hypothetical protein ERJ75_001119600 [Trypanosoma vivax]|nr:hypothetical protein ERJ75_001119600 [Trypanosoma vivax]